MIREPSNKTGKSSKHICRESQQLKDSVVMTTLGKRSNPPESVSRESECPGTGRPTDLKHTLRRQMFEVIDNMNGELSRRFCDIQPLLLSCDAVNPTSDLFLDFPTMQPLAEAYAYLGIDCDRLKAQVVVAKAMFKLHIESSSNLSTPVVLQTLLGMECAFPDLVIFTKLVLTIPVSSAGAERSFSAMKRVKTYLRSTMSHNRLSNLCIISIERAMSGRLLTATDPVVDQFASIGKGKRRLTM